ncbi:MAG: FAD:protein FMN transferase, partial [Coriobacteriales bacterium]|nr:FAD:protein FMN transferase [Coriobacteriales bacterium]
MSGADALTTVRGFHFDTVNVISCVADEQLLEEALGLCATFERLLSRFAEGSDVWRINHAQDSAVAISPHTAAVLALAQDVQEASRGAFNIAVGEAAALWDFSSATPAVPAADELSHAATRLAATRIEVCHGDVSLDTRPMCQVIRPHDTRDTRSPNSSNTPQIDLGGIAKGYICDRVADFLRAKGVSSGLLNF